MLNRKGFAERRSVMKTLSLIVVAALLLIPNALYAATEWSKAPPEAKAYVISPVDGETVQNPVTIRFGLKGMGVAPAGVVMENTGHHHLLLDVKALPSLDSPILKDGNHMHFGGGQTETMLTLQPGTHTLQILLGDHRHIPHDPPVVSERITITVK